MEALEASQQQIKLEERKNAALSKKEKEIRGFLTVRLGNKYGAKLVIGPEPIKVHSSSFRGEVIEITMPIGLSYRLHIYSYTRATVAENRKRVEITHMQRNVVIEHLHEMLERWKADEAARLPSRFPYSEFNRASADSE